jgi:hypothetical protein
VAYDAPLFPASTPETLRAAVTRGQQSVADLVDRYDIRNREIRDLLVDYITRRAVELDYSTLQLVRSLVGLFWKTIEKLNPDQADLRLSEQVVQGWKESLLVRPDGKPHLHIDQPFMVAAQGSRAMPNARSLTGPHNVAGSEPGKTRQP